MGHVESMNLSKKIDAVIKSKDPDPVTGTRLCDEFSKLCTAQLAIVKWYETVATKNEYLA